MTCVVCCALDFKTLSFFSFHLDLLLARSVFLLHQHGQQTDLHRHSRLQIHPHPAQQEARQHGRGEERAGLQDLVHGHPLLPRPHHVVRRQHPEILLLPR